MQSRHWDAAMGPQSLPCLEKVRTSGSHSSVHGVMTEHVPRAGTGRRHQSPCLLGATSSRDTQLNKRVLSEGGAMMRDARQGHGTIGARGWGRVSSLCGLELRPASSTMQLLGETSW